MRIRRHPACLLLAVALTPCLARAGAKAQGSEASQQADADRASSQAQSLFNQAATLIKQGRYSDAVPPLKQAAKLAPNQASVHHYLGYAYWKLDRWKDADAEFLQARKLNPKNPYTCYFLARIAGTLGREDQAIEYYQAILRMGPPVYDTNQRLGEAYLNMGSLIKARARIEAALQETPWDGSLYYQLARIDQRQHHLAPARREFAAASRLQHASQASIQRLLALDVAVEKRQSAQVQTLRQSFLDETAPDPEILNSVGVSLGRGGLYSDAVEPLERAVALAPDSFESNYNLGFTLLKLGREQDAEAGLNKALALEPQSLEVNRLLGVLYVEEDRNADAIARLRAANEASPDDEGILALLGEQYLAGHYVAEAIPCLNNAVKLKPDDFSLRYLLIEAYEEKNDFQDALAAAQDAARRFPAEPRAVYEVGQQLANLGKYAQAKPYAEKALAMDPSMVYGWNLLGDINSRTGQYAAAVDAFKKAVAIDPKDGKALSGAGANLVRIGKFQEAVDELNQGVAVDPEYSDLYFNLIQAYSRLGERDKAREAEAAFQKYHAIEVAARNAAQPRAFSASASN